MIGHPVTEILTAHPDNQDAIPLIARAAAGEPISARLWEMRTPEGSCWVEAVATQVIDARGVVVGIQGVSRDVTERRLAEEALRTSEERFRDVFHNAPIGIAVVSPSGEVLQSNRALAVMLGYSEAEAVGLRVWDVLHPEDVASVRRLVEATVAGERTGIAIECRHVHRDGHVVWTALHAILERAPDGTPRRFVSQLADITDRRAAESALRASERRFRTFAESMAGGVLIAEPDGIVYANDAISVITGYGRDELSRMQVWDLVHPDERASVHARVVARFEGVRTSPHAAYRIVTKAGDVRWVDLSIALIDLDGVPAILGTAFDVTERRRAQDALRASLDELRNSEDKLRSLAQRQVAVREEERKRLSFDLHDDVCQELVGVGILLESVEGRLGGRAPEVVSELRRAARYLSEVIEHLRVLARDLRPMSLQDLGLEASLRSLAGGLSSERTTVDAVFTTPVPRLGEAVEVTVYRIAQEALTNAIRHADARRVTLRLVVNGDRLFLDVSDDGCGFDHAERARHAFGLAIMEERAQALAGRLTVASRAGEGTRVSLDCPLAADPSASAAG